MTEARTLRPRSKEDVGAGVPAKPLGQALEFLRQFWRLNHAIEQLSGRMVKKLGVTAQQRVMLRYVGQIPGIAPGQLAELLHLDRGTVSTTIGRLEAKGLVERRPSRVDGRRSSLTLTTRGSRLDRPTDGTVEGAVEQLFAVKDPERVKAVAAMLDELTRLVDSQDGGPGACSEDVFRAGPVRKPRKHQRGGKGTSPAHLSQSTPGSHRA